MGFLFGNILTVTAADLWALGGLVAVTAAVALLAYRSVMYVAFDRAFARSRGVPVMAVSCAMAVLVALSIVCCIRSVGIVLLIALLTVPAAIVNGLTRSFSRIALWSSVVAVVGNCFGLWLSYRFDIPAGAATIFLLALTLIVIKLLPLCGPKRAPRSEDDR